MPSTDRRLALSLSFRRAELAAFWLVGTACLAFGLGLGALAGGARSPRLWAAAAAVVLVPGLVSTNWFIFGVRAWNKCLRLCARPMRMYVLRVCYYTCFAGIGRAGSSLDLRSQNGASSRWTRRPIAAAPADMAAATTASGSWADGLRAAARQPGAAWMLGLLPIVLLLRVLDDQQVQSAPAKSTYTLY
jgi:hypothetical protein